MGGAECHLRTFVVTGGRANTAFCITVYGQACDVDGSSADALVRFFLTTNTQCERVAHELVCIKASDTVSESDGGEVHKVHEGVDLVEFLTLQHPADELFAGRTVAGRVFAAGLVDTTGGSDAG